MFWRRRYLEGQRQYGVFIVAVQLAREKGQVLPEAHFSISVCSHQEGIYKMAACAQVSRS